jgi:hypothetical protein
MRQHPAAEIHALTDIQRERIALTVKQINARQIRQCLHPRTQMFGIFIDSRGVEFQTRGRLPSHYTGS